MKKLLGQNVLQPPCLSFKEIREYSFTRKVLVYKSIWFKLNWKVHPERNCLKMHLKADKSFRTFLIMFQDNMDCFITRAFHECSKAIF